MGSSKQTEDQGTIACNLRYCLQLQKWVLLLPYKHLKKKKEEVIKVVLIYNFETICCDFRTMLIHYKRKTITSTTYQCTTSGVWVGCMQILPLPLWGRESERLFSKDPQASTHKRREERENWENKGRELSFEAWMQGENNMNTIQYY